MLEIKDHTWYDLVVHVLGSQGEVRRGVVKAIRVYTHHITLVVQVSGRPVEFSIIMLPFLYVLWQQVDIVSDDEAKDNSSFAELVERVVPAAGQLVPFRVDLDQLNLLPA